MSSTHCPVVHRYIANQEEHHRQINYTEELIKMLTKNGVVYDPKYLA